MSDKMKQDPMDILNQLQPYVEKWSKQGRTDDQIWAVKNFLTGQGRIGIKEISQLKEAERGVGEYLTKWLNDFANRPLNERENAFNEVVKIRTALLKKLGE